VRLASGEAFFQVSKDASRPFTVETPAGSVRATGTAFNVLAESPAALDVTVTEGTVAVRPSVTAGGSDTAAPSALTAGDHLSARATTGVSVKPISTAALANKLAWRQGAVGVRRRPARRRARPASPTITAAASPPRPAPPSSASARVSTSTTSTASLPASPT